MPHDEPKLLQVIVINDYEEEQVAPENALVKVIFKNF